MGTPPGNHRRLAERNHLLVQLDLTDPNIMALGSFQFAVKPSFHLRTTHIPGIP